MQILAYQLYKKIGQKRIVIINNVVLENKPTAKTSKSSLIKISYDNYHRRFFILIFLVLVCEFGILFV